MKPKPRSTWDQRITWDHRIRRAAELEQRIPSAAEPLRFYQNIAKFQKSLCAEGASAMVAKYVEPLLALVQREGPALLAETAAALRRQPAAWQALVDGPADEPTHAFFARVLRQPGAELAAARTYTVLNEIRLNETRTTCPFCAERPVTAILRPEGDGGKRSLLCSLCFTEWDFRRLLCPHCGEEDRDKLPVFTAQEFPHIRVEACDSCKHYIKSVDLTVDGLAIPEVDELAAIPLDLWAAERGYVKLTPNLLGF